MYTYWVERGSALHCVYRDCYELSATCVGEGGDA